MQKLHELVIQERSCNVQDKKKTKVAEETCHSFPGYMSILVFFPPLSFFGGVNKFKSQVVRKIV